MKIKLAKKVIVFFLYTMAIIYITSIYTKNKMDQIFLKEHKEVAKFRSYYNTFIQWMLLIQEGKTIADYFEVKDRIAVYGMGKIGELIGYELLKKKRNVVCGIDKNNTSKNIKTGLEIYSVEDISSIEVDYVIISIPYLADEIVPMLHKHKLVKAVTIDEITETLLLKR